jgi:hypothetical protein
LASDGEIHSEFYSEGEGILGGFEGVRRKVESI